jgi:colicin import membrane protein
MFSVPVLVVTTEFMDAVAAAEKVATEKAAADKAAAEKAEAERVAAEKAAAEMAAAEKAAAEKAASEQAAAESAAVEKAPIQNPAADNASPQTTRGVTPAPSQSKPRSKREQRASLLSLIFRIRSISHPILFLSDKKKRPADSATLGKFPPVSTTALAVRVFILILTTPRSG